METPAALPDLFRLTGGILVEPARNRIGPLAVEPKVMEVLRFLCAHARQVVSRQEIIDAVWGVAHGGDESLTRAVSLLRKALQPSPGDPELIRTIPKRGYCLEADVTPEIRRGRPASPRFAGAALLGLALLAGMAWFLTQRTQDSRVDGIVVLVKPLAAGGEVSEAALVGDELRADLAHFDQIKVRPFGEGARPDAAFSYVYVVSGALTRDGDETRLAVRLEDGVSADSLWSGAETYRGAAGKSVSTLAAELELAVLRAAKLSVQKKPVASLSPWELILLGTWVPGADREWPGAPDKNSYWLWDRAIAKAPEFALAHASLAQVMANFALFDPPSDIEANRERAARAAARALELAPYDAAVLFQLALYHKYRGEREAAAGALRRVLELEPENLLAGIELAFVEGQCGGGAAGSLSRLGALDQALPPADPAHWVILSRMADLSLGRGEYAAARDYARRSRAIILQTWSSITLAAADAELGEAEEARRIGAEHRAYWPSLDYAGFAAGPLRRWCLGGDEAKARDAFERLGALSRPQ